MSVDKQICLLDELQSVLEKQIDLVRKGNISDVEILSERAGLLVEKIAQTGTLEMAEFKNKRECLAKLYRDLCLAITAQKADTSEELNRIRKGRKTIKTYRSSI